MRALARETFEAVGQCVDPAALRYTGFSTFAAPEGPFAHLSLNRRVARIDGHSNLASGRRVIEARLVEPAQADGVGGVGA